MRVPLSWLREHVELPEIRAVDIAEALVRVGLKVERIDSLGADIDSVVVARVLDIENVEGQKKPIRFCRLDDGTSEREVICGATNFAVGDLIAYARPPALLPGGYRIEAKKAYGRMSDGMICSERELGLGDDHTGILVLPPDLPLGADVVDALHLRDDVLDIAVNPDRGYALSVRGVAREVGTALGVGFRDPALVETPPANGEGYVVRLDDIGGCDRYVARVVTGLDPKATSPGWLQRRLTLAGMRPISLAVDVTNYVMLDLGQPLHAFDRERLQGPIVVRRAAPGERLRTLDDVDRALHPDDLLITDDSGPIAIAGVMGGGPTEVSDLTTQLVVESAHFDPVSIARSSRRHRLSTEASRRFERGVDDALSAAAAEAAVRMLVELAGAAADPGVTDVDSRQPRPVITLAPGLPGRLAGVDYSADAVRRRLADVGCTVSGADPLQVTPPSWRPDLRQPVDLVEEVVRLEGYDALPSTLPAAPAGAGLTRSQRLRRVVSRALAGNGHVEVLTYPFVAGDVGDRLLLAPDDPRRPSVRLANPVSDEEDHLRASLLPGLLAAADRNVRRGFADVALYEIGSVFRGPVGTTARPPVTRRPTDDELATIERALPEQPLHVAAVLTGQREPRGWWGQGRRAEWGDAVSSAQTVAAAVGVELGVTAAQHAPWHPGRCAQLRLGDVVVGHAGELHPRVVEAFALPARACAMELWLDPLLVAAPEDVPSPPVSSFPVADLDVALVVAEDVPAGEVHAALVAGAGALLESVRLFDVYTGAQLGGGRKSLAFTLRLRAADRTLTAEEATAARDAAVAEATRRTGAELRSV